MKPIVAGVAGTVLLAGAIFVETFVSDKITVDSNVSENVRVACEVVRLVSN